jgi:hypothetical protein
MLLGNKRKTCGNAVMAGLSGGPQHTQSRISKEDPEGGQGASANQLALRLRASRRKMNSKNWERQNLAFGAVFCATGGIFKLQLVSTSLQLLRRMYSHTSSSL